MFFKSKIRKTSEYQSLLRKGLRIFQICRDAYDCHDVVIDTYDYYKYRPLLAYPDQHKKPSEDSPLNSHTLCVQVRIDRNEYIDYLRQEIIKTHRREGLSKTLDSYGRRLVGRIFGKNTDEFLSLTQLDGYDIAFYCIDLHPETDEYIFHFNIYCLELKEVTKYPRKALLLLNEDINKRNYKVLLDSVERKEEEHPEEPIENGAEENQKDDINKDRTATFIQMVENKNIYQCTCDAKFRVPADRKHIIVTCPSCHCKWDIMQ